MEILLICLAAFMWPFIIWRCLKGNSNPYYQRRDPNYDLVHFYRIVDGQRRPAIMQVPRAEMQRLIAMTYDREKAERLLIQQVNQRPGRRGRWYVDKVIWDLERDRR